MSFFFLILSLVAVVIYTSWILFKPKKKHTKKKSALKNKASVKKQKPLPPKTNPVGSKKVEQLKKDPEIVSQVIRHWLNQK